MRLYTTANSQWAHRILGLNSKPVFFLQPHDNVCLIQMGLGGSSCWETAPLSLQEVTAPSQEVVLNTTPRKTADI